jgi:hypothetical protein
MNLALREIEGFAEYRGVSVCVLGTIDNWREVAKDNCLVAESQEELLAWWMYYNKPLEVFKGNYLILHNEPIRPRLDKH